MRKLISLFVVGALFSGFALTTKADDGKKVTLEGMAQCGKCALKETKECQNVVVVTKDEKTTKYFLVMNDVSKKAHQALGFCEAAKDDGPKVKVVGLCKEEDGKLVVTPESIVAVED